MRFLASASASSLPGIKMLRVDRDRWEIGARGVDADAPLRPLTPQYNFIPAILATFCRRHFCRHSDNQIAATHQSGGDIDHSALEISARATYGWQPRGTAEGFACDFTLLLGFASFA